MEQKEIRKILLLAGAIALSAALEAEAVEPLDLASQALLRRTAMVPRTRQALAARKPMLRQSAPEPAAAANIALVKLEDGSDVEGLLADGFRATALRGGFAVVTCDDRKEALRLAHSPAVKRCEFNRQRTPRLDLARQATSIDQLHAGDGLPARFTGKGVITGIVDVGFDINHVNFKDAGGNSRIKYFSTVDVPTLGTTAKPVVFTPEQLVNFSTDDNTQTHGTHTLGIMAGSFQGEATVARYNESATIGTEANPYYGVAYESDIYASTGSSYDALIAYAVEGMMENRYYKDHGRPIVVNLSLGGNSGPHDGSGMLSQYLDIISEEEGAVFCVSAGNEGDVPIAYHQTLASDDDSFATFIRPYVYTDVRYGMVELYSDTEQDFDVSVIIYNRDRQRIARTFPLNNKDGEIQYICSGTDYQQDDTDIIDATFAKAYDGYVGVGGKLDEESGRFYVAVDYYVVNSEGNPADENTEAQYTIGFQVTGHEGQRIDCFCDGTFTVLDSYGYDGFVTGSRNGTVSDIATTKTAIAVGAYTTREWGAGIYGDRLGYDGYFKLGEVADFSSYATLVDGRNVPHVLAPGCSVVSSISTPYFNNTDNGVSESTMSVKYTDGNRNHYFSPMIGTSMAAPMGSGVVALMLQANPDLRYDQIREILMQTAVMEPGFSEVEDPVQAGSGRIDALAAVKEALRLSTVRGIESDPSAVVLEQAGPKGLRVFAPGESLSVALYGADGRLALSQTIQGDEVLIDLAPLSPGIYVLSVNGVSSRKIAVR